MSDSRPAERFADLAAAEAWLEGLINVERRRAGAPVRLGLAAIEALLARLGNPEAGPAVIHVAGSKGKGSTALLCEALLRALGRRVGTFTSPHLERWTERFRIDGAEVGPAALLEALTAVRPHVEALRAGGDPALVPSWFDVTTAVAFWLFRQSGVSHAVVEVGLGGRLDSTNVVDPAVACITSLELEHTDVLGNTLAAIAREKAGILKPGRPAVVGPLAPEAAAVVEARAKEIGAPLARCGHELDVAVRSADASGLEINLRDGSDERIVRLPLLGAHQAVNAALAVAAVRRLPGVDAADLARAVPAAFAKVALPGRVERVSLDPPIVVDAAHTAASARALAVALRAIPHERLCLVLSVSSDKDLDAVLGPLLADAHEATVTRAEPTRSLAPAEVAAVVRRLSPGVALRVVPNPHLAVRAARERMVPGDLLCVAGSIYLAGIARGALAR